MTTPSSLNSSGKTREIPEEVVEEAEQNYDELIKKNQILEAALLALQAGVSTSNTKGPKVSTLETFSREQYKLKPFL